MIHIDRVQQEIINKHIANNKVLVMEGTKYCGKKTMLKIACKANDVPVVFENLSKANAAELTSGKYSEHTVVIDDAQHIENLESFVESALQGNWCRNLVLTSANPLPISESLYNELKQAGLVVHCYPPSFNETAAAFGLGNEIELLEKRLIYGNYPDVLNDLERAEEILINLIDEVIDTRLGGGSRVNNREKLLAVLRQLAFNIGNNISYNEIGIKCGLDNETVKRYVQVMEEANVLLELQSYHNEHRYELKKGVTVYFLDNGMRNAVVKAFNAMDYRNDHDMLWMNYLVSERYKWIKMNALPNQLCFWMTNTGQKIDLIEFSPKLTKAYDLQWDKKFKSKFSKRFSELYPFIKTSTLNLNSYWSFLSKKA